ncbi:hypothetical protein NP233_g11348 [Leucocoprinus birnbaumii]|uniref:Uncharacterized protein n=1 Tax=Leucocoprinus birnbaumii TaxID=56174 RepID=A0AAD5YR21_9AGAR|nr:hypothetical protein NP233_g11348 [Leucocoprinus birnbaumii]
MSLPSRPFVNEDFCTFESQKLLKLYSANDAGELWLEQADLVWVRSSVAALWPKIVTLARKKSRDGEVVGLVTRGNHVSPQVEEGPEHATVRLLDRFYVCFGTLHVACNSAGETDIFTTECHCYNRQPMRQCYKIEDVVDLRGIETRTSDVCKKFGVSDAKL